MTSPRKLGNIFCLLRTKSLKSSRSFFTKLSVSLAKLRTLHTDNGGEYISKAFLSYCANVGILRQLSQPYMPQHNGVAERRNRTILDIVRNFLANNDIPSYLWTKAV